MKRKGRSNGKEFRKRRRRQKRKTNKEEEKKTKKKRRSEMKIRSRICSVTES